MEEQKVKKTGALKWIIIAMIIIVVLACAVIGGYFAYQAFENNKSVGEEWGDIYYAYLEKEKDPENETKTINRQAEEYKIQFLPQEEKAPIMTVEYTVKVNYDGESKERQRIGIFYINDKNEVKDTTYEAEENSLNVEILYNKKEEKYKWYRKHELEGELVSYTDIEKLIASKELERKIGNYEEALKNDEYKKLCKESEISFKNSEMPKEKIEETTPISKFEETFIVPDNVPKLETVIVKDLEDLKDIKKQLTQAVEVYKPIEEVTTEEVKQSVTEAEQKIEERKEAIKKAEEEAKKKAEEEAKKKAEEEAKKGLKIGNCTLKYGRYVIENAATLENISSTITLKQGGTFHIKSTFSEVSASQNEPMDVDGTYTIALNKSTGYPGIYANYIQFKTNKGESFSFEVYENNKFSDQWHIYTYAGN